MLRKCLEIIQTFVIVNTSFSSRGVTRSEGLQSSTSASYLEARCSSYGRYEQTEAWGGSENDDETDAELIVYNAVNS